MGAVGKGSNGTETFIGFDGKDDDGKHLKWWVESKDVSNLDEWDDNLTDAEKSAIFGWVLSDYAAFQSLYNEEWDNLPDWQKKKIAALYEALNKFELKKGITVNRATDFQIFDGYKGKMTEQQVRDFLMNETDGGLVQSNGFMSFSTRPNGVPVTKSSLVIHLNVPPNKGLGAYISTPQSGDNLDEREYLTNTNSVLKFDPKSVRTENGKIHVNARLVGRAQMQTIDSKNDSKFSKKKK